MVVHRKRLTDMLCTDFFILIDSVTDTALLISMGLLICAFLIFVIGIAQYYYMCTCCPQRSADIPIDETLPHLPPISVAVRTFYQQNSPPNYGEINFHSTIHQSYRTDCTIHTYPPKYEDIVWSQVRIYLGIPKYFSIEEAPLVNCKNVY